MTTCEYDTKPWYVSGHIHIRKPPLDINPSDQNTILAGAKYLFENLRLISWFIDFKENQHYVHVHARLLIMDLVWFLCHTEHSF